MDARVAALVAALAGCGGVRWRNADLQLDVAGADWTDEDLVRVCVAGVGEHEEAASRGLIAFPGLPLDDPVEVRVSILGQPGEAGPVALSAAEPYARVEWTDCEDCAPCTAEGAPAAAGDPDRLLAVRLE